MNAFFERGQAIDVVLAVIAAEAIWLIVRSRGDLITALLPGALILLGLRAALTGAGWQWVALWLTLSLPAHIWDMRRRLS